MPIWSRSSIPFPAQDLIEAVAPFSAAPYQTPAGVWAIGYGSYVDAAGRAVTAATPSISQSQAANLLATAFPAWLKSVGEYLWCPALEYQVAAMVSFVASEGEAAFANSPMIKSFNAGQVAAAGAQLPRFVMLMDPTSGQLSASLPLLRRRVTEMKVFNGEDVATAAAEVAALTSDQLIAFKTAGDTAAAAAAPPITIAADGMLATPASGASTVSSSSGTSTVSAAPAS